MQTALPKVVILAGGKGTRLGELTQETPKPLVMVGNKPLIQHIIDLYVADGFREFIVAAGYLSHKLREYFAGSYRLYSNYWDTAGDQSSEFYLKDVSIDVIDSGNATMTGGRLLRLKSYLSSPFCMTYGDGISTIKPSEVVQMGVELSKSVVTAVHPAPRFGALFIAPDGEVMSFSEKTIQPNEWINGGFMYLQPTIFQHIDGDSCNLEKDALPKAVWERQVVAYKFDGYWQCCDTARDLQQLNEDHAKGLF